jgi:hypothetical protein
VIVHPLSEPIVPSDWGARDWQPLVQSNMRRRRGARLPGCPPIGRTIGMVSSALSTEFALTYLTTSKVNKRPTHAIVNINWILQRDRSR